MKWRVPSGSETVRSMPDEERRVMRAWAGELMISSMEGRAGPSRCGGARQRVPVFWRHEAPCVLVAVSPGHLVDRVVSVNPHGGAYAARLSDSWGSWMVDPDAHKGQRNSWTGHCVILLLLAAGS